MNLNTTIIPKSDQLNADDLIGGARTIKITSVDAGSAEQPVSIRFDGDNGRPYKPSKSMRRVLVMIWGADGNAYVGRRITLYRDPLIKFGGEAVGGICISHASDIAEPVSIALTVTRGKRKPFKVDPLPAETMNMPADELQEDWDAWSLEERGANRASLGTASLSAWWKSLSKADREALTGIKDAEWKPTAAKADAERSAS